MQMDCETLRLDKKGGHQYSRQINSIGFGQIDLVRVQVVCVLSIGIGTRTDGQSELKSQCNCTSASLQGQEGWSGRSILSLNDSSDTINAIYTTVFAEGICDSMLIIPSVCASLFVAEYLMSGSPRAVYPPRSPNLTDASNQNR